MKYLKSFIMSCFMLHAAFSQTPGSGLPSNAGKKIYRGGFVNILVAAQEFANGLNETFEVIVMPVNVMIEAEKQEYMDFPFMKSGTDDGATYKWQKIGHVYKLFRILNGRTELVDVFALMFPHEKMPMNKLKVRSGNPSAYSSLKANEKLNVLGVMGTIRRGAVNTVIFKQPRVFNDSDGNVFQQIVVTNVDEIFHKYALSMAFKGVPEEYTYQELQSSNAFWKLYATSSKEKVLENAISRFKTVDSANCKWTPLTRLADAPNPAPEIEHYYVSRQPTGKEFAGGPLALWLPFRNEANGNKTPILVFPGAYASDYCMNRSINRTRLIAQWWHDASLLDIANEGHKVTRELLLRLPVTHMYRDIYNVTVELTPVGGNPLNCEALLASNRFLLHLPYLNCIRRPDSLANQKFPWEISAALNSPTYAFPGLIMDESDVRVANVIFTAVKSFTSAKSAVAGVCDGDGDKTIPSNIMKDVKKQISEAICFGFIDSKDVRSRNAKRAVRAVNSWIQGTLLEGIVGKQLNTMQLDFPTVGEDADATTNIYTKAFNDGYQFSDIEWLFELTKTIGEIKMPFSSLDDNFKSRLEYLKSHLNENGWNERKYLKGWPAIHWIKDIQKIIDLLGSVDDGENILYQINTVQTALENYGDTNDTKQATLSNNRDLSRTLKNYLITVKEDLVTYQTSRNTHYGNNLQIIKTLLDNPTICDAEPTFISNDARNKNGMIWPKVSEQLLSLDQLKRLRSYYDDLQTAIKPDNAAGHIRSMISKVNSKITTINAGIRGMNPFMEQQVNIVENVAEDASLETLRVKYQEVEPLIDTVTDKTAEWKTVATDACDAMCRKFEYDIPQDKTEDDKVGAWGGLKLMLANQSISLRKDSEDMSEYRISANNFRDAKTKYDTAASSGIIPSINNIDSIIDNIEALSVSQAEYMIAHNIYTALDTAVTDLINLYSGTELKTLENNITTRLQNLYNTQKAYKNLIDYTKELSLDGFDKNLSVKLGGLITALEDDISDAFTRCFHLYFEIPIAKVDAGDGGDRPSNDEAFAQLKIDLNKLLNVQGNQDNEAEDD